MNSDRFFIPNMTMNPMMMRNAYIMPRNADLLGKFVNGIKSFNWAKLLSGANKTLNVMNQTIPLIRQTKPIISNVKSMLQLAKAFRSETGSNHASNRKNQPAKHTYHNNDEYPTFFI